MFVWLISVLGLLGAVRCHFYEPNTTVLSTCKIHYSRSGSVYKDFYSIPEVEDSNSSLTLDFHFAVMAPSDAHILLAPSQDVAKEDPAYEIVIGAGGNTFCDIRRKQKSNVEASQRVKGLLSALDPNFFWVHISKDGVIEVGKEGEELPFITWTDPDPLPLKVISFSTWSGIEAKWYFDCQRNDMKEVERPLTSTEKLRRDLITSYDPYSRPVQDVSTITVVQMAMQINHVELDEHQSTVEVRGMSKMAWHDEKLKWDPEDYDNLSSLHIFRREIWQPELVLYNGVDDITDLLHDSMMVVQSSGLVEWNPAIRLRAWCDIQGFSDWPRDKHRCSLTMGFLRDFNSIWLEFTRNDSGLILQDSSQWTVLQADVFSENSSNETSGPALFQMTLVLQRTSAFYRNVFFTFFLMISIFHLGSFWMDPFGVMKITTSCFVLILTTLLSMVLGSLAPRNPNEAPYLVKLYSFTVIAVTVELVLAAVVINLCRVKRKGTLPHFVITVLTSKVLSMGLFLPKVEVGDEYGKLNSSNVGNPKSMWALLGVTFDRITFVVYLIGYIYAVFTLH